MSNMTPMMKQYCEIKKQHKDAILFFRLGDFYEMFYDDAIVAAKELEIALTTRGGEGIDMCGIPYHVSDVYVAKLIEKGYKVAICEQVEDPKLAKGIVKREVIRIVTPGTVLDTTVLEEKTNNYLVSIYMDNNGLGFSYVDMSTGEIYTTETQTKTDISYQFAVDELGKLLPSEIIVNNRFLDNKRVNTFIENRINPFINSYEDDEIENEDQMAFINKHFVDLDITLQYNPYAIKSLYILLKYLYETQHKNLEHISNLKYYNPREYMVLDINAINNLELKETILSKEKKGSLLWTLDKTSTAMGGRLLKKWIEQPLLNIKTIKERQDIVEIFYNDLILLDDIKELLKNVYDLERLIGKISYGNCNARDLNSLKQSLYSIPSLKELLINSNYDILVKKGKDIDDLSDIYNLIDSAIVDNPPISLREGGIIKKGFDEELDNIKVGSIEGKQWIANIEAEERKRTNIKNLKIGFNKQFGYYIEITNSNLKNVPDDYIRRQTLKNAERYYTPELKEIEDQILGSEDLSIDMEYNIFQKIRETIKSQMKRVQLISTILAEIDVLKSFGEVSYKNNYVKPKINIDGIIDIKNGRHPVVEETINDGNFVPNNSYLDNDDNMIQIITGPNMAGKSTYMRQVAIIVLMTQIGSFIPAEEGNISIVDKIFTRIGASDNLSQGESTFMVEMNEVSNIVNNATSQSLVILDEVGRGTSTYDGLSIAWALIEYMATVIKSKTLFATHYHELTDLESQIKGIKNLTVLVEEKDGEISFLRKIVEGSTDESYGIEVAKLAGINKSIIRRSNEILLNIENGHENIKIDKSQVIYNEIDLEKDNYYKQLEYIVDEIEDIDINNLTLIDSMNILNKLREDVIKLKGDSNE